MGAEVPKLLTTDAVRESDVVITMGCGDTCPIFPGKRYEDWDLDDPAGQGVDAVRPIRDEIRSRVVAPRSTSLGVEPLWRPPEHPTRDAGCPGDVARLWSRVGC